MMMKRTPHDTHGIARALCATAAMVALVGSGAALAQTTDAYSNNANSSGSGSAPAANANGTTATGTTSRTDHNPTRNRARRDNANPSGEYVPRTGSSSHRDKNGNVVKDRSTGGSPQGRERPPASPPNIPATQP